MTRPTRGPAPTDIQPSTGPSQEAEDEPEAVPRYHCLNCGRCCHEVPGTPDDPTYKRIPLYPDEADRLVSVARERDVPFKIIEDLVFPDALNEKILVVTYRVLLNNPESVCPFHEKSIGCTIHEIKPLACRAYPLAVKTEDAFTQRIEIDPICKFTVLHRQFLENIDDLTLKQVYPEEYQHALAHLKKNKRVMFKLMRLEREGKIRIPKKISAEDFDACLKKWDRVEIR